MMSRRVPTRNTVDRWIQNNPELEFNGTELYCKCCEKLILCTRKSNILKHITSENHKVLISGGVSDADKQRNFNIDFITAMVGCNIPLFKVNNPLFRQFLSNCVNGKYDNVAVPAESTLRTNYVSETCTDILAKISSELQDKRIWVSVDETTNATGENIVHVFVGGMDEAFAMRAHLISSKMLQHINTESIANSVNASLKALWGDSYEANKGNFLLFVTNGASFMKAAERRLKATYCNMIHVTCLVHGLHQVAETIRTCFPNVDTLISNVEKVFLKAPERRSLFQEVLPDTPLPPEPILTQWGTWIKTASYYYINFDKVKSVIEQLDPNTALAISRAQQAFVDPTIRENLSFIHGNFSRVPSAIHSLEHQSLSQFCLVDAMNVVYDLRRFIFLLPGTIADHVRQKFKTVLNNNPGFNTMCHIVDLFTGKEVDFSDPDVNVASLRNFQYFKYAPLTAVDVKRSFSDYKWIFNDKRQNLSPDRLEQLLIIYFYSNVKK